MQFIKTGNSQSNFNAIPRIENLTQKRGKKLTELLKLFSVEEGELQSSGSEVVRTTTRTGTGPELGQVCVTSYSSYSLQFPDRATIKTPTISIVLQCLTPLVLVATW